jgi:hypothetical protein
MRVLQCWHTILWPFWYIVGPFGIFYGIWYISCLIGSFFPVLVFCCKKNLATLLLLRWKIMSDVGSPRMQQSEKLVGGN